MSEPDSLSQALSLLLSFSLIAVTGFFVAAEFSLVKVRATRIEELASAGVFGAKKASAALRNLDGYLYATKLGVMLATLALGKVGDPAFEHVLKPMMRWVPQNFQALAITALALILVAVLEFMLGELIPTTIALKSAEKLLLKVIYPLSGFYFLFSLPISAMKNIVGAILKPFGISEVGHGEDAHSEDEIRKIMTQSAASGTIDTDEVQLAHRIFDFSDLTAREIMVPRPDVAFLHADRSLAENVLLAEKSGYSRFPLLENGSPDRIVGMTHAKDLLRATASRLNAESVLLRDAVTIRDVVSFPETKLVDDLLRELQKRRQRLAIVVDEYGGTAGIVTLEDIVEEIVGDIQDEFDRSAPEMEPAGEDCWTVDGAMSLDKLSRALDLTGPEEEPDVDTVGGWIMVTRDSPPKTGDSVRFGEATFTVTHLAGRRVRRVRVCLPERRRRREDEADVLPPDHG